MSVIQILVSIFGSGFAGTIVSLLLKGWIDRRDKEIAKREQERAAAADAERVKLAAQEGEQAALKEGVVALLHDRIYAECAVAEDRGCVTVDGLRNLEYLYGPYHSLGGNGTGTVLYERYKKLPVKPVGEETA